MTNLGLQAYCHDMNIMHRVSQSVSSTRRAVSDNDESWAVIKAISCPALSLYNGPAMDGLGGAGGAGYTPIHNKSPTLFYIGPGA